MNHAITIDEIFSVSISQSTHTVIERLAAQPDRLAALSVYADAVNDAYWKRKNLYLSVALARAGIQQGLTAALSAEPDLAAKLRSSAKAMAYNLASFTWPGWDEPGIDCEPGHVAAGHDAAKLNLRLARELNKGDLPMSRGLWMLAGHELCRSAYGVAREQFEQGAQHGKAAGSAADEALGHAFAALAEVIEKPADASRRARLDELKTKLAATEEGPTFVQQVDTAMNVFLASPTSSDR